MKPIFLVSHITENERLMETTEGSAILAGSRQLWSKDRTIDVDSGVWELFRGLNTLQRGAEGGIIVRRVSLARRGTFEIAFFLVAGMS